MRIALTEFFLFWFEASAARLFCSRLLNRPTALLCRSRVFSRRGACFVSYLVSFPCFALDYIVFLCWRNTLDLAVVQPASRRFLRRVAVLLLFVSNPDRSIDLLVAQCWLTPAGDPCPRFGRRVQELCCCLMKVLG